MHRLLPKPLSDMWTGWEAAEAAVANDSHAAAAAARDEQVALVMSSLASASLKSSSNAPSEVDSPVEVAERRTDAHRRSTDKTAQLVRKWESQSRSPQFAVMQQQRQALPAWSKRAEIIAAFNSSESRVFLVQASLRIHDTFAFLQTSRIVTHSFFLTSLRFTGRNRQWQKHASPSLHSGRPFAQRNRPRSARLVRAASTCVCARSCHSCFS